MPTSVDRLFTILLAVYDRIKTLLWFKEILMYFSPTFLQNSLYIVAAILIIFIIAVITYKIKHAAKIWDKTMTLASIVLVNTLYSILGGFIDLPYELSSVVTGGLSLVAFGYIVVIIWDLHKQKKTINNK